MEPATALALSLDAGQSPKPDLVMRCARVERIFERLAQRRSGSTAHRQTLLKLELEVCESLEESLRLFGLAIYWSRHGDFSPNPRIDVMRQNRLIVVRGNGIEKTHDCAIDFIRHSRIALEFRQEHDIGFLCVQMQACHSQPNSV
jgi:hypothetical protein